MSLCHDIRYNAVKSGEVAAVRSRPMKALWKSGGKQRSDSSEWLDWRSLNFANGNVVIQSVYAKADLDVGA